MEPLHGGGGGDVLMNERRPTSGANGAALVAGSGGGDKAPLVSGPCHLVEEEEEKAVCWQVDSLPGN